MILNYQKFTKYCYFIYIIILLIYYYYCSNMQNFKIILYYISLKIFINIFYI